jgi:hypothetical protein
LQALECHRSTGRNNMLADVGLARLQSKNRR